eukprot:478795_1
MTTKVFNLKEILSIFSTSSVYTQLIDEIKKGFISYSMKVVYVAPVIHLGSTASNSDIPQMIGGGDVCLKSGYIINDKYYVIKIAGGGFKNKNTNQNYPNSGAMLVFSQMTGALNGILLDNGILTELRTAAASALASKYFAPKQITNIGIIGTGIQARFQLDMLQYVIPFNTNNTINVYVYGRSPKKCEKYQNDMLQKGIKCKIAQSMYDIGTNCNLIIMCTSARSPVLMEKHLNRNYKYGLHINCIGADSHGKQELDEKIISKYTDLVIVDSKLQCFDFGEVQNAVKNKTIVMENVMEFGDVLNDNNLLKFQRQNKNDKRVTLFDSTGVAVQDVVIAKMVYQTLIQLENSKL